MSNLAEGGAKQETKAGGGKGDWQRKLLETSPLFLFGSMLFNVFSREGVSDFLNEATKTLDFFGAPFSGKGGGGGGGGEHAHASAH